MPKARLPRALMIKMLPYILQSIDLRCSYSHAFFIFFARSQQAATVPFTNFQWRNLSMRSRRGSTREYRLTDPDCTINNCILTCKDQLSLRHMSFAQYEVLNHEIPPKENLCLYKSVYMFSNYQPATHSMRSIRHVISNCFTFRNSFKTFLYSKGTRKTFSIQRIWLFENIYSKSISTAYFYVWRLREPKFNMTKET